MIDETALTKGSSGSSMPFASPWDLRLPMRHSPNGSTSRVEAPEADTDAEVISDALWALVGEGKLSIRRGGYIVRRGRRRVIVEPHGD